MTETIPLHSTKVFTKTFLDYISGDSKLQEFYNLTPHIESFSEQINSKFFPMEKRKLLFDELTIQYKGFEISEEVNKNIESLLIPTTYTITTGHQLNIFGGPLYFIYKIITTINTAKALNLKYGTNHFIPVFWMASEDHDFEEINHFNLFGKTWKWETNQKGAVGRFSLEGIDNLLNSIPEKIELFEKAYRNHKTLSAATRYFVNELFGSDGLIIIDADSKVLKGQFSEIIKDEIIHKSSFSIVQKTSSGLDNLGYEAQVHAREINLFYLENNIRERIVSDGINYLVNNANITFSEEAILNKIKESPENFSPNVILRPLYQECILPNLAYIGGPAEVIYWLQLKGVFEFHKIAFPILMPRNFALVLNKGNQAKLRKLSIDASLLFLKEDQLKSTFLAMISEAEFKLGEEKEKIKDIFSGIQLKAVSIDKTMEATVLAELQKSIKILEDLEKRLKKAEERKNEIEITQLLNLKEKLFPGGSLQERFDNFLSFFLTDRAFLSKVKASFNPFDFSFYLIKENE